MAPTLKLDEFDRVIELDEGRCPGRTDEAFFPANIPAFCRFGRSGTGLDIETRTGEAVGF